MEEPSFINRDPEVIKSEMIAYYENLVGKTLLPAQAETMLIQTFAYREYLMRIGIQDSAKQNLLAFSSAPFIDYLGAFFGVVRLEPKFATTTLSFTIISGHTGVTIPSGTRVATVDGKAVFETDQTITVDVGTFIVEVDATAQASGLDANDYALNTVNVLLDPLAFVETVENTTVTSGGSISETDDQLRERIGLAPSTYSNAGSVGAYRFWAKTASPLILDVGVPKVPVTSGQVDIYPLTDGGVASQEILDAVKTILDADIVRPLTDTINVANPTVIDYNITAELILFTSADETSTISAVETALEEYTVNREKSLGLDIVIKQIENIIMSIDGVYDLTLSLPSSNTVILENQFAKVGIITITASVTRQDG